MNRILGSKIIQNATNPTTNPQLDFPLFYLHPMHHKLQNSSQLHQLDSPSFYCTLWTQQIAKLLTIAIDLTLLLQSLSPEPTKSQNKLCTYIQVHTILTHTTQTNFQTRKQASKQTSSSWHSEGLCVPLRQVQTSKNQNRK